MGKDAEDCGIDPDAQRQHQHRHGVEARRAPHAAPGIAQVGKQLVDCRSPLEPRKPSHQEHSAGGDYHFRAQNKKTVCNRYAEDLGSDFNRLGRTETGCIVR